MCDFIPFNTSTSTSPQLKKVVRTYSILWILLGFVLIWPTMTQSAHTRNTNYYVSPNGNDNNPGTIDRPWQHIDYAASNGIVQPGDTVYIRGGYYRETIRQKLSGSPDQPITYRNFPGETPVITDDGSGANWRWQILDQSYLRIEGLVFSNYKGGALQIRTINGNITDIAVTRSIFQNQQLFDDGQSNKAIHVTSYTSSYALDKISFRANRFLNLNTGAPPADEVLMFSGNVHHSEIVDNTFIGSSNIVIDLAGRPDIGQPHHILIKGNDVSNFGLQSSASGIYMDGAGTHIVIEENIVHDGPRGITVNLEQPAASLETRYVIVRRNALYNNEINLKLGVAGAPDNCATFGKLTNSVAVHNTVFSDKKNIANHFFGCGSNLRWQNNIFSHGSSSGGYQYSLVNDTVDPSTWVIDYNLFQNDGGSRDYYRWDNGWYDFLSGFQQATNQDTHSLEADPLFWDASNHVFWLQSASPARDAGGPLTFAVDSGSGTTISVDTAWYFSDGMGLQTGDLIQIGNNSPIVVTAVNYTSNQLTVKTPITWKKNDPISYQYVGTAPDMGAYEFINFSDFVYLPLVNR